MSKDPRFIPLATFIAVKGHIDGCPRCEEHLAKLVQSERPPTAIEVAFYRGLYRQKVQNEGAIGQGKKKLAGLVELLNEPRPGTDFVD